MSFTPEYCWVVDNRAHLLKMVATVSRFWSSNTQPFLIYMQLYSSKWFVLRVLDGFWNQLVSKNEQLLNAQLLGELFLCKFVIRQDDFGAHLMCFGDSTAFSLQINSVSGVLLAGRNSSEAFLDVPTYLIQLHFLPMCFVKFRMLIQVL